MAEESLIFIGAEDSRIRVRFTKAGQADPGAVTAWNDTNSFSIEEGFDFSLQGNAADRYETWHWASNTKTYKLGLRDPGGITVQAGFVPTLAVGSPTVNEWCMELFGMAYGGLDNNRTWIVIFPLVDGGNTDGTHNAHMKWLGQVDTLNLTFPQTDRAVLNIPVTISSGFVVNGEQRVT